MKGFAAAQEALAKQQEQMAANRPNTTFRFRIKPGEDARVVFISSSPQLVAREHTVPGVRGGYDNVICLDESGENPEACPFCREGNLAPVVAYFTVLHLTEFETRSGNTVVNPVRTLAAKSATITILQKYAEKQGDKGLTGMVFDVSRSNKRTSPNVGDVWMYDETISKAEIMELNPEAKPLDFDEEVIRYTFEQMESHVAKVNVGRDSRSDNRGSGDAPRRQRDEDNDTSTSSDIDW